MKALLHRGGLPASWGNLGLWSTDRRYADAAAALARAVGQAAALQPGARVLSVACGAGDELLLWLQAFGAQSAQGWDRDARAVRQARALIAEAGLSARCAVDTQAPTGGAFDAVLCVDAAYHLSPRTVLLDQAWSLLRAGARWAFTDLVLEPRHARSTLLRAAGRLCGVPHADLVSADQRVRQLQRAGFVDVQMQRLDDAVLGGFARFVQRQQALLGRDQWRAAWLRPAVTAALIEPCRSAGLGYALFSARRPGEAGRSGRVE